jgi:hypothetical protein
VHVVELSNKVMAAIKDAPFRHRRLLGRAVAHQFQADHQAAAAHVAKERILLRLSLDCLPS